MSEARIIRDRHQAAEDQIDRAPSAPPDGARSLLATTTTDVTYPTTAGVFYAVLLTDVSGAETEGATPTFATQSQLFYAVNFGTAVPPVNTVVLIECQCGLWVFRYDG
jgi:hypothetical protein